MYTLLMMFLRSIRHTPTYARIRNMDFTNFIYGSVIRGINEIL